MYKIVSKEAIENSAKEYIKQSENSESREERWVVPQEIIDAVEEMLLKEVKHLKWLKEQRRWPFLKNMTLTKMITRSQQMVAHYTLRLHQYQSYNK